MFAVIFEVHPGPGKKDSYLALAKEMKPVIESIDGFIDNERFESRRRPGWVLSHSTWRDEKSVIRWRTESRHHIVQEKGRGGIFSDYRLRVGEITADSHPPEGLTVREQRFDVTEAGRAKLCTVTEFTPQEGAGLPEDADAFLAAAGLATGQDSLVDHDIYDSIYNPGKVLLLASWTGPDAAAHFLPAEVPGTATLRHRPVRVIREYGMFDRRETTTYYPEVKRSAAA